MNTHIIEWNNDDDSQYPNDIPKDTDSLQITDPSTRDDSKLHEIVIALLKCSQEKTQCQEDSDGKMKAKYWSHKIHRLY